MIKAARQDADFQLVFSSGAGIDIDDCKILCSSDLAFANVDDVSGPKIKSQAGYVLGIRAKGGDKLHFVEFQTGTVARVCRSTLSAEANGLVAAVEAADYLRSVVLAIVCPTMSLGELMYYGKKLRSRCTRMRSPFTTLSSRIPAGREINDFVWLLSLARCSPSPVRS